MDDLDDRGRTGLNETETSDLLVSSWTADYDTENGPSGQDKTSTMLVLLDYDLKDGTVSTQASHSS